MNLFNKDLKLFDVGFNVTSLAALHGSNIYNLGGYTGSANSNNELEAIDPVCDYYGQLVNAISRLTEYRRNDLVKTVLRLYKDSASSFINYNATDIVEIQDDKESTKIINEALHKIQYLELLKEDFNDLLFYGSVSHQAINGTKMEIKDLKHPYSTGYYRDTDNYIVMTDDGPTFVNDLLRFSFNDLRINLDDNALVRLGLRDKYELEELKKSQVNSIYSNSKVVCSEPLFLSVELKLKDYILKDLISAFLSLISLIEQETYSIDGQRLSDTTNLLKLCEKIKGLLVTQEDMNLLASARLDKNALVRRLFDRVRVIPSVAGNLQNLTKLEQGSVKEKLDTINNQKEIVRDEVLTAIGFPVDLYKGNTTRWEASRQTDSYNIKLIDVREAVDSSTRTNVVTVGRLLGRKINKSSVKVLFTEDTPYQVQNSVNKIDNAKSILTSIQDILRTSKELLEPENEAGVEELNNIINETLHKCNIKVSFDTKKLKENKKSSEDSEI